MNGAGRGHEHDHGHELGGHTHVVVREDSDTRRLAIGLALIVTFMVVEIVAGILANSLALLSDAAHMLTDAGALLLALVVLRLVRRPAGGNLTFGLQRTEALSAQANGATLLVLACLIVYGGIRHLISPPQADGWTILLVSLAGVAVTGVASHQLAKANRESMNIEGAFQHIWTDMIAFVATGAAGAVILTTGFYRADAIAALFVAAIMLRASVNLLRASGRVLLEIAPAHLDVAEVGGAMARHPRVREVHDLHVWEIASGFPALSAHVLVDPDADCHGIRRELELLLDERFAVDHTTLQVDHASAEGLLQIGLEERGTGGPPPPH
jgi:cobalt-zinc-cadmium efflux system protein